MKVVQLTAGTGNFYCGNCVRDSALVGALAKQGHDALMVPLYLPMVTDEADSISHTPIFYGGINVYLQQKSDLFRRTPRWIDALFDGNRLLRLAARKAGMTKARDLGEITVSMLKGEAGKQVKELNRLIEWLAEYGKPDLVCLSNALLLGMARRIKSALSIPVVCTLQGEDGFLDSLVDPYKQLAWETMTDRAKDVDAFVAISRYYAGVMRTRLSLRSEQVHVVHNGIALDGYSTTRQEPSIPTIGYLARMCPDKGLDKLVDAFMALKTRGRAPGLKLRIAGTMTESDEPYVRMLKKRLANQGLSQDVSFHSNISLTEKIAFLESLSVFSVPATYGEAFGLYVIESLAAGVPVVQPSHAAFPELLESTGGGILYDTEDPNALTVALESLLIDPIRARELGERGRRAVQEGFSVDRMAEGVSKVFEIAAAVSAE
jgi:glycosyltransferase involved in cell wall biosynthesis